MISPASANSTNIAMINIASRILFEDNHLLIVNKLPSELVQGDKTQDASLLDAVKEYIRQTKQKEGAVFAGLIHRIDRPVSGVVMYARTSKALSRMNAQIKERKIQKQYLAIVRNKPPLKEDELEHFIWKNEKLNKSFVVKPDHAGARQARLTYQLISSSESFHLLKIMLHTGRHHQIRVQLAEIGCPLLGDLKYGDKRSNPDGSICLHAYSLDFEHPVQKTKVQIKAPMPDSMPWKFFTGKI